MENQAPHLSAKIGNILAILAIAIFQGVLFDYLFFGKFFGISFPIYISLILCAVFSISHFYKNKFRKAYWWLIVPILFFSVMVAFRASILLTFLNILASMIMGLLLLQMITGRKIGNFLINDYAVSIVVTPFRILASGSDYLTDLIGLKTIFKGHPKFNQILKGVLMALPVLIIFLVLFSSADLVFNKYVANALKINVSSETIMRLIIIFAVTFIISGILYFTVNGKNTGDELLPRKDIKKWNISVLQISIFLGLINALFLCFIIVQLTYLFGGENNISVQGFTYAEYARRGFFELIWVAILSFLVIFISEDVIEKKDSRHTVPFQVMAAILAAQVIIIMIAAFKRLGLYESFYGFTELRLYSHIFIVWLGIVFLILLYKIFFDHRNNIFMMNVAVLCVAFLCALNLFNPDAFIARQNIERIGLPDTVSLDTDYLYSLSDDAIPELAKAFDKGDEAVKIAVREIFIARKTKMEQKNEFFGQWQSWNYGREKAKEAYASVEEGGG